MSNKILEKIHKKEKKRQELLSRLLESDKMVRGSFCQIYVKCGKKSCWCAKGKEGHPHVRMSWNEKGHSYSRAVPKEDRDWIKRMTDSFREFRKIRKEIVKIEEEINDLFDEYENKIVDESRKGKIYLELFKT